MLQECIMCIQYLFLQMVFLRKNRSTGICFLFMIFLQFCTIRKNWRKKQAYLIQSASVVSVLGIATKLEI